MQDFCFKASDEAAIISALESMGLTTEGLDGKNRPVGPYCYTGQIIDKPGQYQIGPDGIPMTITEPTYLPGVYAAYRATDEQAATILATTLPAGVDICAEPPVWLPKFGGVWLSGVSLAEVKADTCARLNAKRDAIQYGIFKDSNGHAYDTDAKSREKMTGLEAKIANGLTLPNGFTWTGADNVERPHTNASFLALTTEILLWTSQVHDVCVAAKTAIRGESVTTAEQVAAIEAGVVWP